MLPLWRLIGASVTGTSHTKSGLPCQDAHAYREVSGCALMVVADGAGSAERSAEGAQAASQAALTVLSGALDGGWPLSHEPWRDIFAAAYAAARAALEQLAAATGLPVRAFASTLLCAALSDRGLAVAQLGDGVAAAFAANSNAATGGDWFLAAQPQRGEYANETYFLSQTDALQHLEVAVYAEPVRALALMTDGLLRLVLNPQRQPHEPFFRPLLTFGVEVDDAAQGNGQLAGFLASERVCARTDDDKTVVLALRLPEGLAGVNVFNARRQPVALGAELGRGGEAVVYKLAVQPALLAKIYHGSAREGYEDKLAWMQANPPDDPTRAQGHASIAWPNDLLYNASGHLAGYVMVNVQNAVPLLLVFNPRSRAKTLPSFNRRYLHRAARNLAAALGALHAGNYIVGDLNESNVMVTPSALITLIDADSFQVQRRVGSKPILHPCPVGKPEYTPPELQGKTFAQVPRQPEHDRFGLAVLIFQLLMEGNHPFRAQWLGSGDPPPVEDRIRDGAWPYAYKPVEPIAPPRGGPGLSSLHPTLAKLARQAFIDGHLDPRARPLPEEWEEALHTAEDALITCAAGHLYSNHLSRCPECQAIADAARSARARPAPSASAASSAPPPRPSRPASPPPAAAQPHTPVWPGGARLGRLTWSALNAALRPGPVVARASITCRACGRVNPVGEIYCQNCAQRLGAQRACPHCRRGIPANARFCPKCGRAV